MAFNGRFVLNVADFARKQGADYEALIALSGYGEEFLSQPDSTIDRQAYSRVVEEAVEMTNDAFIGLHMGEGLGLAAAGLIGQITQTSATVLQALEYCCSFANLGCSELPMELVPSGDYYKIRLRANPLWEQESPAAYRHTAEGVLAFTLRECRDLTRLEMPAYAIHLPWDAPTDTSEYQRVFGTTVQFKQEEFAIILHRNQVEAAVTTADYQLLRLLVTHAEERSAQLRQTKAFADVVRQSMIQLIEPAFPSIEQVAKHLNLSLRTLQRRLQEEGVSYKNLLEEVRKDFALSYLRNPELTVGEIAYLLGYRETSAFSRACKRWIGQSPQQWRATTLGG
ncbi:MAG: AraC family transcriptional regulator ligand-binding domain-containing protein [Bacteroidota bacterium]